MNTPLSLLFQRMRVPLVVLIGAYAVATLGFTLIPGYDDSGEPWTMNFLHAFYVVSYTGSTIGFGEIPAEFSDGQRMWALLCIYMTVFAWLFAIGSLVGLVRDDAFHEALGRRQLQRTIRGIRAPFYLICGYGGAGSMLVDNLVKSSRRVVVVDRSADAIRDLQLQDYNVQVPGFRLDASVPESLIKAGLQNRWCAGLLALTDSDETNLKIALAGRLLNQKVSVAARADSAATSRNMISFETGFVIRPAEEFAQRATLAVTRPQAYQLYERLSEAGARQKWESDARLDGIWLICGQDDFGRLLAEQLEREGVATRIIAEDGDQAGWPRGSIFGPSSEGDTLEQAGIGEVTGLITTHANDAENLSTIMTALMLNPELLVIARENHLHNRQLFEEAGTHLTCSVSGIVASAIRPVLEAPMVPAFFEAMLGRDEGWSRDCLKRIHDRIGEERVQYWSSRVSEKRTPPLAEIIESGGEFTVGMLTLDPRDRNEKLDALVLMIGREDHVLLLPDEDEPLAMGDRILFCGTPHSAELIWAVAVDPDVVRYLQSGHPRLASRPWWWRTAASP
ncbi:MULTISPECIES: NAD-binding protein [unclassified Wenzhouxiangella]|uniref:NAD-binding protein n=1 Tax=unclassified Wenzhouxiangella TaxID=2613841 RepID=UPI000E326AD0|nr:MULTISPECIES: NAD-binding protein [unclassified Wenzhouxiangella]RFF28042.1 potassium transporter TrkA [Wenzhouxiangella sp. 15181]RFP68628.1 potassium transporter TrkA [Wenzhouxiangella sp. 15190]